ncbi:deoxyhypusine synthase family protein [Candidatus Woesearchaeota archaeon]|nr:deoxyhypusine synthase family protein [Candidatus Woesearchaeota archaeon]
MEGETRDESKLRNGFQDGLIPLEPLDLSKVNSIDDLVKAMSKTAFTGRKLGEAADVLEKMWNNKNCYNVLTLSGAMTVAKMGLVICDMIDSGMVDCIVSTGALMAHGFIEAAGMAHFKYKKGMDDKELYYQGYDRIYDTLELEKNFDDAEFIFNKIIEKHNPDDTLYSLKINQMLGKYLKETTNGRGVLKSAYEKNIPVFIPAFTDSEFGLDFSLLNRIREKQNKPEYKFDPFIDIKIFTDLILEQNKKRKELGIFTIGGGVPRNWTQQIGPQADIIQKRMGDEHGGFVRFKYGVRICPEPVHWGGLSGCTYSEGVSWGKFVPEEEGGQYSEVPCDATVAWPLIVKSVLERKKE